MKRTVDTGETPMACHIGHISPQWISDVYLRRSKIAFDSRPISTGKTDRKTPVYPVGKADLSPISKIEANVAGHERASARSVAPLVSLSFILILQKQSFGPPPAIGFPPIP